MDASFLHIEDDVTPHAHRRREHLRGARRRRSTSCVEMVGGKLPLVPRYRQKVRFVPLALGRPVWVDDPHFNLDYHLRHTALPGPGRRGAAARHWRRGCSPSTSTGPSRCGRSGWSRGSSEGRWALLSKVHHCMVDGVSATDLMSVMFDRRPGAAPAPSAGRPSRSRPRLELLAAHAHGAVARPARAAADRARPRARAARSLARRCDIVRAVSRPPASCARWSAHRSTGPIGPHRAWSWAHVRLSDVKAVRAASAAPSTTSC